MKTLLIACVGVLGAGLFAAPAQAQFYFGYSSGHGYASPRANHGRHHDDLDHRSYHRELDHREVHRYPMTHRQHGRVHDQLDHGAFHDSLEHRGAHQNRAYSPYYNSYSTRRFGGPGIYYRPGLSIQFGY